MFCIYKSDNTARVIADVRELNKVSVAKHYPLPKIQDIFHRRKGYKYVTLLDMKGYRTWNQFNIKLSVWENSQSLSFEGSEQFAFTKKHLL